LTITGNTLEVNDLVVFMKRISSGGNVNNNGWSLPECRF
jgi:hypothetical protein